MDATQLIAIVQGYEELYNFNHPDYSNHQRRDIIWDEIGKRLKQKGNVCKERWTRIRDNYRKALNLRKTKSGQAASKIKPPKFSQELAFLAPYVNDDEEQQTDLSPVYVNNNDESQFEAQSDSNSIHHNELTDTPNPLIIESATSSRILDRNSSCAPSQELHTPEVLQDYLARAEQNRNENDPLLHFFISMAKTVKTFPLQDQIQIKAQLFEIVNSVEMRLATTPIETDTKSYGVWFK
ncbi:hypothetical protein RR46_09115 [Papilio xuthus]|uniref:Transcription factor Adf-1 n=1 Tax=Papilio xuthus TaxID=66420 RepID=A0A194PW34_PAPXU|nr:hypothetical protein RR46_09115 [Papilio xuthus]